MLEGWRRASAITAILGALGAAAVLPAGAADTVKIGILWPLTGNAAAAGQASKAAAEVAADIVNNSHPEMANLPLAATAGLPGLGGAKLELVFADHQGNPSVAQQQALPVINENTDYGTSVADEIEAAARKANLPVAMRIPYGANSADVSAQVLQLKERRPDVVIFISYTPDAILYIKTMKNLDYLPPMVIGA